MTLQQAIADMRDNIAILRMARPPALATENVIAQLVKFVNNVEQASMNQDEPTRKVADGGMSYCVDYGRAGVATVHHYEVRETVAGRCNLVATFTDPHRAAEYAERIAREDGE